MANLFTKIFGTHSSHELKKIYPIADKVDALEEQYKKMAEQYSIDLDTVKKAINADDLKHQMKINKAEDLIFTSAVAE